jgi:hypothetical protein
MTTQSFKVGVGQTSTWQNASGEALALTVKALDGTEITFNVLPGQSARLKSGTGPVEVDINPRDESLVGLRDI